MPSSRTAKHSPTSTTPSQPRHRSVYLVFDHGSNPASLPTNRHNYPWCQGVFSHYPDALARLHEIYHKNLPMQRLDARVWPHAYVMGEISDSSYAGRGPGYRYLDWDEAEVLS